MKASEARKITDQFDMVQYNVGRAHADIEEQASYGHSFLEFKIREEWIDSEDIWLGIKNALINDGYVVTQNGLTVKISW